MRYRSTRRRPFTPLSISGCIGWFDASDVGPLTATGVALTQWNDKSGNNCHLDTAMSAMPVWNDNFWNNLPIVRFASASSQAISTTTAPLGTWPITDTPHSLFAAFKQTTTTGTQTLGAWQDSTHGNAPGSALQTVSTNQYLQRKRDTSASEVTAVLTKTLDTNWHIISMCDTGTATDVVVDGVNQALADGQDVGTTTINKFALGVDPRNTPTSRYNGDLGEVIAYDRYLPEMERKQIERYLGDKWAVRL